MCCMHRLQVGPDHTETLNLDVALNNRMGFDTLTYISPATTLYHPAIFFTTIQELVRECTRPRLASCIFHTRILMSGLGQPLDGRFGFILVFKAEDARLREYSLALPHLQVGVSDFLKTVKVLTTVAQSNIPRHLVITACLSTL